LTEGHEVEFLEPNTKVVEIKQGSKPAAIADEMVALGAKPGLADVATLP
jgi:hypothetical protein